MPLIKDGTLPTGELEGQEHGATVSLILDEGEPGHAAAAPPPLRRDVGRG